MEVVGFRLWLGVSWWLGIVGRRGLTDILWEGQVCQQFVGLKRVVDRYSSNCLPEVRTVNTYMREGVFSKVVMDMALQWSSV